MKMSGQVRVVIVSYFSASALLSLFASLEGATSVVVVDNVPDGDAAVSKICSDHGAQYVLAGRNIGFGRACNLGAMGGEEEFVLFLNPDTRLTAGSIAKFVQAAQAYPDMVAANPVFVKSNGSRWSLDKSCLSDKRPKLPNEGSDPVDTPFLSGAAFFVRREAFTAVGGFDEAIFLFHEDDDLSIRLNAFGSLRILPNIETHHAAGGSTPSSAELVRFKAHHMARSRIYVMRKHGRRRIFLSTVLPALMQLASPSMRNANKRAKRLGYLSGAWPAYFNKEPAA